MWTAVKMLASNWLLKVVHWERSLLSESSQGKNARWHSLRNYNIKMFQSAYIFKMTNTYKKSMKLCYQILKTDLVGLIYWRQIDFTLQRKLHFTSEFSPELTEWGEALLTSVIQLSASKKFFFSLHVIVYSFYHIH